MNQFAVTAAPGLSVGNLKIPTCVVYAFPKNGSTSLKHLNKLGNELEVRAHTMLAHDDMPSAMTDSVACGDFSRKPCEPFVEEFERSVLAVQRPCIYALLVTLGERGLPVPTKFLAYYTALFLEYLETDRGEGGEFRTFGKIGMDAARGFLYAQFPAVQKEKPQQGQGFNLQ